MAGLNKLLRAYRRLAGLANSFPSQRSLPRTRLPPRRARRRQVGYQECPGHEDHGQLRPGGFVNHWNVHRPAHNCAAGIGHLAHKGEKLGALLGFLVWQIASLCRKQGPGRGSHSLCGIWMVLPPMNSRRTARHCPPNESCSPIPRRRTSKRRSPAPRRRVISGNSGSSQAKRTRLVQLPTRSQTTAGASARPRQRPTKSSSFVISVHPPAVAKFQMLTSSESRKPASRTGVAAKPHSPSQPASAGGSWASTRKRTAQAATRTGWSRYRAA